MIFRGILGKKTAMKMIQWKTTAEKLTIEVDDWDASLEEQMKCKRTTKYPKIQFELAPPNHEEGLNEDTSSLGSTWVELEGTSVRRSHRLGNASTGSTYVKEEGGERMVRRSQRLRRR